MILEYNFSWQSFAKVLTSFLLFVIFFNSLKKCTAQFHLNMSFTTNLTSNSPNSTFYSVEATRPHYVINPLSTNKLALWEENLVQNLTRIINSSTLTQNDPCSLSLKNYLRGFHKDIDPNIKSYQRAKLVTENPILTFRMIRRVFVDLQNETKYACQNSHPEIVDAIENAYDENMTPVTSQDLDDALWGLLRIQFVYGFNATSEIRLGIFNGMETGTSLSHEECVALAKKAMEIDAYILAHQWLVSASLIPPQNQLRLQYTQNGSCMATHTECDEISWSNLNNKSEYSRLWMKLLKSANIQSKTKLQELLSDMRQTKMKERFYEYSKYASCRGENTQTVEGQSKLVCYYTRNSDPYFYINPIKTEMLSKDPLIVQFYELIGDETIELISNLTSRFLVPSTVILPPTLEAEYSTGRTSINGWLEDSGDFQTPKKLVELNKRVEKLTGLKVTRNSSRSFQVVMYGSLGGHFDFHDDAFEGAVNPEVIGDQGDRIVTFLFYLSNVTMGGYTAFPKVGVFAKPLKGSAILWYNLYRNGTKDMRLEHGGCPVILGTKHVANRWIFETENMWRRPCLLDRMA